MLIARKITPDYIVLQVPDLSEALCAGAQTSDWRIIPEAIPAISLLQEGVSTPETRTSTTQTSTTSITGDQSTENPSSKL